MKKRSTPINNTSLMQISGLSSSSTYSIQRTSTPQNGAAAEQPAAADQAFISSSGDLFSSLVKQAGQMPEVRSDVVDSFKARIAAGQYPTQEHIDNLVDAIGGGVLKLAESTTDAS